MASTRPPSTQIKYKIAGCSEHSGRYVADNIKHDRPNDQTSRWSSAKDNSIYGRSWILIELENVSLLESITFGKVRSDASMATNRHPDEHCVIVISAHPCNMKDFEVHVGLSRDYLTEVLKASLKNDSKPETFPLRHKSKDGLSVPTRFVKIVSLSAHGTNFNTSIWYVALSGITDERYVRRVMDAFENNRETLAMRHILKHLRQRRHITTYKQLQERSGVRLEHPLVSDLYETLVLRGDWVASETQLKSLSAAGLFSEFIHSCTPRARWKRLRGTDANGDVPGRRGGHAMCMDVENGLIYLFGGYDGHRSLDDFWVYNVREGRWRLLSHSVVEEKNGPTPRACHKMVFDPRNGCIYVLGRLSDGDFQEAKAAADATSQGSDSVTPPELLQGSGQVRSAWSNRRTTGGGATSTSATPPPQQPSNTVSPAPTKDYLSELYRYRTRGIDQGNWELLNYDTSIKGGPKLIYDHQLVLDSESQVLYVQGGRIVDDEWKTPKYSGLYSYDLRTDKWTMIQTTTSEGNFSPRLGHSMVFEPHQKKLFIFAGRKDEYLSDMWEYDLHSRTLTELFSNVTAVGGPEACFAQRAVIDPGLKEIYVFEGVTRRVSQSSSKLPVSLYRYGTRPGTWTRVPTAKPASRRKSMSPNMQRPQPSPKRQRSDDREAEEVTVKQKFSEMEEDGEPVARSACQVVYDLITRIFYLHGGTAQTRNEQTGVISDERLDDFWSMTLERPSPEEIVRRATFEIRRQQFREMCEDAPAVVALAFLQNEVSAVVNHEDNEESAIFRSLLTHLLARPPDFLPSTSSGPSTSSAILRDRLDSPSSSNSESGEWTSELPRRRDEDVVMTDSSRTSVLPHRQSSASAHSDTGEALAGEDDPYELALRGGKTLSGTRFTQRTEVFESLLRFIGRAARAKQPEGSLLDMLGNEDM
ncbi:hypothetical protein ACEPAH_6937 [Sanghuangporus vaninii]